MSNNAIADVRWIAQALRLADIAHAEALAALAATSYCIAARRSPLIDLPLGASRFGGSPDVPEGFAWPVHRGRPLTFLAQLDLSGLSSSDLPATGWLLFFYDVAEQPFGYDPIHAGGARVVYLDGERDTLDRIEHPDVMSAGGPFESCALSFTTAVSLVDPFDRLLAAEGLEIAEQHRDGYRAAAAALSGSGGLAPFHHLLGHPQLLQGDMRGQCQLVSGGIYCGDPSGYEGERAAALLRDAAGQWRLLLQLDTDEAGPDFQWSDAGRIYYWIRHTDLGARAFDRSWVILQCA
jgi:uncharacterized protein YwqG